jgi:hypothetical protein
MFKACAKTKVKTATDAPKLNEGHMAFSSLNFQSIASFAARRGALRSLPTRRARRLLRVLAERDLWNMSCAHSGLMLAARITLPHF